MSKSQKIDFCSFPCFFKFLCKLTEKCLQFLKLICRSQGQKNSMGLTPLENIMAIQGDPEIAAV